MHPKRILSGIQPSGGLHLGNYFGAIQQHVAMQEQGECYYFIADYHALTTIREAETLRANIRDVAVTYLACGLDPARAALFRQSDVPEVTELMWLLMTVTPMGFLERAVSYKDKVERGIAADAGLFTYPVLMAADIMAYDSDLVPVGQDQVQHVEMTRDMATYFNQTFHEEVFKLPAYKLSEAPYVPGVDGGKMSKSYGNTIEIMAEGKELKKRVSSIVTDPTPLEQPLDPDKCNVFALYKLVATPAEVADMAAQYRAGGFGYGNAKKRLLEAIDRRFAPVRARRAEILAKPGYVDQVLADGAQRARPVARATLSRARKACGLA